MTRAEFIERLKKLIEEAENDGRTAESAQNVQNDDLISRKAAIEGANRIPDLTGYAFGSFIDMLTNLPSVQPEIIRCEDCKYWDTTWQNDWAKSYHYCPLIDGIRNGDWYCADAER